MKEAGAALYCWSSGGGDYARASAAELGLEQCFVDFLPKPHTLIDDVSFELWGVRQFHPNQAGSLDLEGLLES